MIVADEWVLVARISDIPRRGARAIETGRKPGIALFRTIDDRIYALENACPHKQGPLSEGIVHGDAVACPLHNWRISLTDGQALGEDEGCTPAIAVRIDGQAILLPASALGRGD
jgi:nitrite reductase (NADH) small subunit